MTQRLGIHHQWPKLILLSMVALMLLSACAAPVPAGDAAAPAAEADASGEASMDDGTAVIGMNELVTSLDPPTDWAIAATWIHMNLFDCLVWRDPRDCQIPALAGGIMGKC